MSKIIITAILILLPKIAYGGPITTKELTAILDFQYKLDKLDNSGQTVKLEREKKSFVRLLKSIFVAKQRYQLPNYCTTDDVRSDMGFFKVSCIFWIDNNTTHQMDFIFSGNISQSLVERFQTAKAATSEWPFHNVTIGVKQSSDRLRDYIWFNYHREIYINADLLDIRKADSEEKIPYTPPADDQ